MSSKVWCTYVAVVLSCFPAVSRAIYTVVRDYSGQNFFSGWDFYGNWDNLTSGDVQYLNQADATTQNLAFVNSAGNAIIKVDNASNVPYNFKRNSIRIETKDSYPIGSLWIIDAIHMPYGCSVWPAFWTKGNAWPLGGEIDIIEGVNLMPRNQMALHSTPGCMKAVVPEQTGQVLGSDCSLDAGCVVAETKPNSFGSGFAQAGGGVFATQFDVAGIFMWFWTRSNIPDSIKQSNSTSAIDISTWGPPTGSYPASTCNITQFFTPQQLILDITLCGVWAGVPAIYNTTCSNTGPTGICYNDNVVGPGSPKYDNAYFEIPYLRAYTVGSAPSPTPSPPLAASTPSSSSTSIVPQTVTQSSATAASGARRRADFFSCSTGFWLSLGLTFSQILWI